MNHIDLDPSEGSEEMKEKKKETSPTAAGFLACAFISAGFSFIAGLGNMTLLFVISTTSAIMFTIVFYMDDILFDEKEHVSPRDDVPFMMAQEYMDPEPEPEPQHEGVLVWTCSYCDTINIWDPTSGVVRCAHCNARYDGDRLERMRGKQEGGQ